MGTSSQGDGTTELIERFKSELAQRAIELDGGADDELFSIAQRLSSQDDFPRIVLEMEKAIPRYVAFAAQRAASERRSRKLGVGEPFLMNREDLRIVFARCPYCEGPHAPLSRSRQVR
jgi:hypothetical protein